MATACEGQDADLCVAGWSLVASAGAGQPVTVSGTLSFLIQDVDGAELFGLLVFLRIAHAPVARLSANLAVTRVAHWIARIGSARQRLDIDSTWIPGRARATTRRRERARPWPLPLPAPPAIQRGGHTFVQSASGRFCSAPRAHNTWLAPKRAAQRYNSGSPFLAFLPLNVLIELAGPVQARLCRQHRRAPAGISCLVSWHELRPRRSSASDGFSSDEELESNMWCPLLEGAYRRRFSGNEHVPQQQGCSAVVPPRTLREPSGAVVHR